LEIATTIGNSDGFRDVAKQVAELEQAGLGYLWIAENSGYDAPSRLGYVAALTERIQLGTHVVPIYTRNPTLMAMTAAGLDYLSEGRFHLGLGVGGLELLEGFFGMTFDHSIGRTREVVEICRAVWAREAPLVHDGRYYPVPLPAEEGQGWGQPRMILEQPVRPRIPIWLAAIGEQSVTQTAEIADGWLPLFVIPEKIDDAWGAALAAGRAKRDPSLAPLQISPGAMPFAICEGEDVATLRDLFRPTVAFFLGAIGPKGGNHYNLLAQRYGYEAEAKMVEELYTSGKVDEAAATVPAELIELTSLIGPRSWVAERIAAYKQAGVTQLCVLPVRQVRVSSTVEFGFNPPSVELVAELKELAQ
jgi:F420-dependent oxidoreductase-like protein